MNNQEMMKKNLELVDDLALQIVLSGDEFDGILNFSSVVLENNGKKYILDSLDTSGGAFKDNEGNNIYELSTKFVTDEYELINCFGEDYDLYVDLDSMLRDYKTIAKTYLVLGDDSSEVGKNESNIERIISMHIINLKDESIALPVLKDESI